MSHFDHLASITTRFCRLCKRRSAWLPRTGCVVCTARLAPKGFLHTPPTLSEIPYTVHEAMECQREEDQAAARRIRSRPQGKGFIFDGQTHTAESFEGHPMFPTERKFSKSRCDPIVCGEHLVVLTGRVFYHYSHHEGK